MSEAKNHHIRGNGLYLLFRQTHFRHSFFALFGFLIGLFLVVIVLMTVVNSSAIQDKMEDSADLLASHMHDQVRSAEDICLWLSMMDDVGVLLKSPELPAYPLLSFDSVMTTMSKNYVSTELFVEKAQKIITSEFGLRAYADYPAPAFLDALHSLETKQGTWVKREYSKGIFTEKKDVFSYIHTLPLFDSKVLGYMVVNVDSSLFTGIIEPFSGHGYSYQVKLHDQIVYDDLGPDAGAACVKTAHAGRAVTVLCAQQWDTLIRRSLPGHRIVGILFLVTMALIFMISLILRHIMLRPVISLLSRVSSGDRQGTEDPLDSLSDIMDSLSLELINVRKVLKQSTPILQEHLIGVLLHTSVNPKDRADVLNEFGISLPYPFFAVVKLRVLGAEENREQLQLIARRNMEERLCVLGKAYSAFGNDGDLYFLVNAKEDQSLETDLEKICNSLQDALQDMFSLKTIISIGLCSGGDALPYNACTAAKKQMQLYLDMDEQDAQWPIAVKNPDMYVEDEWVHSICSAILEQNADALKESLQSVLIQNRSYQAQPVLERKKLLTVLSARVYSTLIEKNMDMHTQSYIAFLTKLEQSDADITQSLVEWCVGLIQNSRKTSEEAQNYVRQALAYIETHYQQRISIPDVAAAVGLNSIYLNRLFKNTLHSTIGEAITSHRIQKAHHLLCHTSITVAEISAQTGFSEPRNFIRSFKKYYGITPGEYRKKI